jgi:hypothetical protein
MRVGRKNARRGWAAPRWGKIIEQIGLQPE